MAVTEGARWRPARRYDATRSLGHVRFDGTPATEASRAPSPAVAWHLTQALIAAESLGAVEVALETSVAYAKERFTFGRAIGSYQAVKHELVEILRRLRERPLADVLRRLGGQDRPEELALATAAFRIAAGGAPTTRRARRSPSTAASEPPGSTTRRSTSAARSSRGGCWAARRARRCRSADELFAQAVPS